MRRSVGDGQVSRGAPPSRWRRTTATVSAWRDAAELRRIRTGGTRGHALRVEKDSQGEYPDLAVVRPAASDDFASRFASMAWRLALLDGVDVTTST